MNKVCTGCPGRGCISSVHAEQDDSQARISLLKQAAGFGCGRAVKPPIEQEQVRRRIRQGANERLYILNLKDAFDIQLASKQEGKRLTCGRIWICNENTKHVSLARSV